MRAAVPRAARTDRRRTSAMAATPRAVRRAARSCWFLGRLARRFELGCELFKRARGDQARAVPLEAAQLSGLDGFVYATCGRLTAGAPPRRVYRTTVPLDTSILVCIPCDDEERHLEGAMNCPAEPTELDREKFKRELQRLLHELTGSGRLGAFWPRLVRSGRVDDHITSGWPPIEDFVGDVKAWRLIAQRGARDPSTRAWSRSKTRPPTPSRLATSLSRS